jgi:hypothetical protein
LCPRTKAAGGLAGGDVGVVARAVLDRLVKDGLVGGEPVTEYLAM